MEYVHGEKRKYYFRHKKAKNNNCIYLNYSPGKEIEEAQHILLSHFRKIDNIKVRTDEKIIPNHITHLVLEYAGKVVLAVEIFKHNYSDIKWEKLHREYMNSGIKSIWISLSEPTLNERTLEMSFLNQKQIEENPLNCIVYFNAVKKNITLVAKHNLSDVRYPHFIDSDVIKKSIGLEHFFILKNRFCIDWLEKAKKQLISSYKKEYCEKEKKEIEREKTRAEEIAKKNAEHINSRKNYRRSEDSKKDYKPLCKKDSGYPGYKNHFNKEKAIKTVSCLLKRYMAGEEECGKTLHEKIYRDLNGFEYKQIFDGLKRNYEEEGNSKAVECCNRVLNVWK